MKLLTLNSHSLLEEDYLKKTQIFVEEILKENIDVFALQEVNQSHDDKILAKNPHNYYGTSILKQNNHALYIADLLAKQGKNYHWIWEDCHLGYDIYDEGIAIFSKYPIIDTKIIPLSKTQDHTNYKTRKALAICCEVNQQKTWFISMHMGWWNDEEEPFQRHWQNLITSLKPISQDTIFLMGDFNNRSDIKDEGYNLILKDKWYDLYELAQIRDEGITSSSGIAGWFSQNSEAIRIDYIFCNKKINVQSQKSIFTGIDKPTISDHFAVLTECTKGV